MSGSGSPDTQAEAAWLTYRDGYRRERPWADARRLARQTRKRDFIAGFIAATPSAEPDGEARTSVQECPDCKRSVACITIGSKSYLHMHDCTPAPAQDGAEVEALAAVLVRCNWNRTNASGVANRILQSDWLAAFYRRAHEAGQAQGWYQAQTEDSAREQIALACPECEAETFECSACGARMDLLAARDAAVAAKVEAVLRDAEHWPTHQQPVEWIAISKIRDAISGSPDIVGTGCLGAGCRCRGDWFTPHGPLTGRTRPKFDTERATATLDGLSGRRCKCGHLFGSHGAKGCTIEIGDSGSGSVADAVFCPCEWTAIARAAAPAGDER